MAIVSLPINVHVAPSFDAYPLRLLPLLTSLTHFGAAPLAPDQPVVPPGALRRRNSSPAPGVTFIVA